MTYKYIGEAVALLGIAYTIVRWLARNAPESDARSHGLQEIDLVRLDALLGGSSSGARPGPGGNQSRKESGANMGREPAPAPPSDPVTLEAAAAMFGITREALVAMEPRERALLLSGYRTARGASRRSSLPGDSQSS